ncbi:MAG: hypothetical protein KIG36_02580 [Eubacteriales bacterium]|nr:hypothetical protein [Eubacteriales bacterium]
MKKITVLFLSLLFAVALLTGCGVKFPGDLGDSMWTDTEGYGFLITDEYGKMNGRVVLPSSESVAYTAAYDEKGLLVFTASERFVFDGERFMMGETLGRFRVNFDGKTLKLTCTEGDFIPKDSILIMKPVKLGG